MSSENPQLPPSSSNPDGATGGSGLRVVHRWPLSRIILLPLLAVCLVLFAVDWMNGRLPERRAYNLLLNEMKERQAFDEDTPASDRPAISREGKPQLTADDVHKLLGRVPDEKAKALSGTGAGEDGFVEVYNYRGVFQNYPLKATYRKTVAALGGSMLVGIQ